jgi:branched-chain amino acid transport system substrate-binding protein
MSGACPQSTLVRPANVQQQELDHEPNSVWGQAVMRNRLPSRVCTSRFLIFLCGILFFSAVGSAQAAESVRIGVSLGLTGKYAALAAMQQRGYEFWQRDINSKGGLLGRPIQIVIVDDESKPERAAKLYKQLIEEDRVDFVFGPYSSGITMAVAPVVEKAGYPMLSSGAASDSIWQKGYKYIFGIYAPASRYTLAMLNLAVIHNLTTVAIVYADDAFSISAAEGARKWGRRLGLKIIMFEKFKKGLRDLTYLAEKAKSSKSALIIVAGHFDESVDMRRALKSVDWYPKAYFATVGPVLPKYKETLGADSALTFVNTLWDPRGTFPESQTFLAGFRAVHGVEPSYQSAIAYAAGQVLEAAATSAKSLDREKIRQALSKLEMYTILGRFKVDQTGIQIKHFPLALQWQKGKKEIVWPEEMQTAEPILK